MVCWMAERPLRAGAKLGIKHTTRTRAHWSRRCTTSSTSTRCTATRPSTPCRSTASTRVTLRTTQPLFCDPYDRNRLNGGFIPVEEGTKVTVGAGMITQTD